MVGLPSRDVRQNRLSHISYVFFSFTQQIITYRLRKITINYTIDHVKFLAINNILTVKFSVTTALQIKHDDKQLKTIISYSTEREHFSYKFPR